MIEKGFSKGEAIKFGWSMVKNNLIFFVGLFIADGLIYQALEIISKSTKENIPALSFVSDIVYLVIQIIVQMGLIKISLRICDNMRCELADFFSDLLCCLPLFFKYLSGTILYLLIVLSGIILLIIPGVIWSVKYSFVGYFIVDKGLGPIEALKESSLITKGSKQDLFLFWLLISVVNFLGVLAFFIGLFVTIPITVVAIGFVYRKLLNKTESLQRTALSISP